MLPPTERIWQLREGVFKRELHLNHGYKFAGFEDIRPFVVDLGPGDIIFIPPLWQHVAESIDDEAFGATLACTYATPLHRCGGFQNAYTRRAHRERWKRIIHDATLASKDGARACASTLLSLARSARGENHVRP